MTGQMVGTELIAFVLVPEPQVFVVRLVDWDCEICILQIHLCHPILRINKVSEGVDSLHLEMLCVNQTVQSF